MITVIMVCVVALAVGAVFAWLSYRNPFPLSSDNAIHVQFAAKLKLGDWPSKMHKYICGKFRMKDIGVLSLSVMQRLLKDRMSMYPLFFLCNLAISLSAILIYYVASIYWNTNIGLLAFALFLFCFWPHQIALMGGFHVLAQVFILVSILFLQISEWIVTPYHFICYGLAGVTGGMIFFTSASGRKFFPLFIGAFLYSQRNVIAPLGLAQTGWGSLLGGFGFFLLGLFSVILVGLFLNLLLIWVFYKPVVTAAYKKSGPAWLNRMIKSGNKYPLERYLRFRGRVVAFVTRLSLKVICYFLISIILSRTPSFYLAQLLVICGILTVVFFLTYPNVIENLREYLAYHYTTYKFSRFDEYAEYFKKIGRPIPKDKRGAGISWIILFFPSIIPFHIVYFLIVLFLSLIVLSFHDFEQSFLWNTMAVIGLSLSPIIYGEWTKAPQSSRAYFPALIGILLLIAYGCFQFEQILSPENRIIFWLLVAGAALLSAGWNIWVFFNDVFPAKMLVSKFIKTMQKLGIKKFYTYDTEYNDVLIGSLPPEISKEYQIDFIESLNEVKQGYVVVPGISSKSWSFEVYQCGIEGRDFDKDLLLTRLIDTKEIRRFSVASFKTIGTSKIWVNESEITTYRNYIINDIKDSDRWRGHAWIVDAGELHAYLNGGT